MARSTPFLSSSPMARTAFCATSTTTYRLAQLLGQLREHHADGVADEELGELAVGLDGLAHEGDPGVDDGLGRRAHRLEDGVDGVAHRLEHGMDGVFQRVDRLLEEADRLLPPA